MSQPGNRTGTGKFAPGTSGNPNGRPRVPKEIRAALEAAVPEAIATLVKLLKDPDSKVALAAADSICDRVIGPFLVSDDDSDTTGAVGALTTAQIFELLATEQH